MRKKILAFVFAAGLTLALAVPLFGSGGTVYAHLHQCNTSSEAGLGGSGIGPENCDAGEQGDSDGLGGDGNESGD